MIKRYTRPSLEHIWSDENKYNVWLQVEIAYLEALSELNKIPQDVVEVIKQKAKYDLKKIEEIDKEVHHDVIAFLTNLSESVGSKESRFLHYGMTSADLVDTAYGLLLRQSGEEIIAGLNKFLSTLRIMALEYKDTVCIGRTHGVHAEPTTFGLKLLCFWDELNRAKGRFVSAVGEISIGMFSGAVGTYANTHPQVEKIAARKLSLEPVSISTQVISRDRHANYLSQLAIIATIIEKIALEIRHLQRTEVLEVEEPFYENQKGSSAMPHKRNPTRSENLCGLARLIRSYSLSAMENIPLWHERDISHSSVERVILPDATTLLDFMLDRINEIILNLNIYPENMKENMFKFGGVTFSQVALLKLVEKGLERDIAYKIIQRSSHSAWNKKDGNFKNSLLNDKEVLKYLSKSEIEGCFNPSYHLQHVDTIFNKVLGKEARRQESEGVCYH